MKTAVIITGHMRSFARCLPNQFDHVYRHFCGAAASRHSSAGATADPASLDFYVSTVRDGESPTAELLRARFPNSRVEIEVLDCQPELPIPVPPVAADWTAGANRLYGHEPYAISVHPQAVLRQLWHLNRGWEFFQQRSGPQVSTPTTIAGPGRTYDLIIRARADNYFRSFEAPVSVSPRLPISASSALTPWWGRFGGINDRFALLGTEAARAYFTTYTRLTELLAKGYPLHPERLIWASLHEAGIQIDDTLLAEFSKLIWDFGEFHGNFRDPEITHIDMAHLAAKRAA